MSDEKEQSKKIAYLNNQVQKMASVMDDVGMFLRGEIDKSQLEFRYKKWLKDG